MEAKFIWPAAAYRLCRREGLARELSRNALISVYDFIKRLIKCSENANVGEIDDLFDIHALTLVKSQ